MAPDGGPGRDRQTPDVTGKASTRFSRWLQARWYERRRPPAALLPLSALFGAVTAIRRLLYAGRLLKSVRLPARVVVIGNLAVGGSGKTPLVAWLAGELRRRGVRVGIVARGYGSRDRAARRVDPDTPAADAGDEPRWLAMTTGVPVVIGADRVAAVRALLDEAPVEVVLSDDGLQHYRLARDVEIVAVDARRGLGNGALLPAGPLREAASRLSRADAAVLKGEGDVPLPAGCTVLRMRCTLGPAERLQDGAVRALDTFRPQQVRALAAIGDPESFFRALEANGLRLERIPLPDHAAVADVVSQLPNDRPLLMTAKDAVKLDNPPANAWRVPLAVGFSADDAAILLHKVLGDTRTERSPHDG